MLARASVLSSRARSLIAARSSAESLADFSSIAVVLLVDLRVLFAAGSFSAMAKHLLSMAQQDADRAARSSSASIRSA